MDQNKKNDYTLTILRVDLSTERVTKEVIDGDVTRKFVGGTGLGSKFLYEEVPAGVQWSDADNRLMFFAGPLTGTAVGGSGTFSIITKGPCTNMAGASQANGFFGAFMRLSGVDGVIVQGKAKRWTRLHIHDGTVDFLDAEHLRGKDTWETEDAVISQTLERCSVFSIGPAGENLVRFASIVGDRGHVAAHNGLGAVMGSKMLKCISAERGKIKVPVVEPDRLKKAAKELMDKAIEVDPGLYKWGTNFGFGPLYQMGAVPVKNYRTNIFPEVTNFTGEYLRTHFKLKPMPCWACRIAHCHMMEVTEGPYKGFVGEEPEYECMAAMGPVIGQTDPGAAVVLSNLIDRLGLDVNESGYMIGWIMECYEKGLLKKSDLDGVEMKLGEPEAAAAMLKKIAYRDGCGNRFAEGVKRAAEGIGGEALDCAVYTLKGATPRGHDHRGHWMELIDTCLSNTGTIETGGNLATPPNLGLEPVKNRFDPIAMSTQNANLNGGRQFEDCLVVCRLCTPSFALTLECLNAVTGWDFTIPEAMDVGRRAINQLRAFNFRHGLTKEMEGPSTRYGSTPIDGPAQGIAIKPHWEEIRRNYYEKMGWDTETGKPLPETLKKLGLENLISELWG